MKKALKKNREALEEAHAEKEGLCKLNKKQKDEMKALRSAAAKAGLKLTRAKEDAREAKSALEKLRVSFAESEARMRAENGTLKARVAELEGAAIPKPPPPPIADVDSQNECARLRAELQMALARASAAEDSATILVEAMAADAESQRSAPTPPAKEISNIASKREVEELRARVDVLKKENEDLKRINSKLRIELRSASRERDAAKAEATAAAAASASADAGSVCAPIPTTTALSAVVAVDTTAQVISAASPPPGSPRQHHRKRKGNVWSGSAGVEKPASEKLRSISSDSAEDVESAAGILPATKEFIIGALKKHFLFAAMKDSELNGVVGAMKMRSYKTGEAVITQGEVGDHFYVVEKGHLVIRANGVEVNGSTHCFGELCACTIVPELPRLGGGRYNCNRSDELRTALASASTKKEGDIIRRCPALSFLMVSPTTI